MNMGSLFSTDNFIVAAGTLVTVLLVVFLHYEVLNRMYHWLPRLSHKPRPRMLLLILVIFAAHTVGVWLFSGMYWLLLVPGEMGGISTESEIPTMFDLVYFSAATYTTVGYGDITVTGPMRILAGTEGLLGLVLITWSASFTFFELQRQWRD